VGYAFKSYEKENPTWLTLDQIYEGLPPDSELDQDDPPIGSPFLVEPPMDDTTISDACVSNHWGKIFENEIRKVI
jgi:hypothetical protein